MVEIVIGDDGRPRCWWGASTPDYNSYHDVEWGFGVTDDHRLFEKICLEGFQSGLSWLTILRKRENFRTAFAGFDPVTVAAFGEADVQRLLSDAGIIRHQGKIRSTINNAGRALELIEDRGSLATYFYDWYEDDSTASGRNGGHHGRVDRTRQGSQEAGVELRRANNCVRIHAGHGSGQRPPRRLLGEK